MASCFLQVHDIVRTVDLDCDGYISWDEFKRAFHEPGESYLLRKVNTCRCGSIEDPNVKAPRYYNALVSKPASIANNLSVCHSLVRSLDPVRRVHRVPRFS